MIRIFLTSALFLFGSLHPVSASDYFVSPDSGYEEVFMPRLQSTSVFIDKDSILPDEPNIAQVQFLKVPPVTGFVDRVNRLMRGITTDIQPEYDHYGHEIRRYMMHVGSVRIYEDRKFLIDQIKNVRKARVISDYWKKYLEEEMLEIQKSHEDTNEVPLSVRTAFKQNSLAIKTFLIVLQSWIESNQRLLMFVYDNPEIFDVEYPEVLVYSARERLDFYNLLSTRQTKLKDLKSYRPYEMMVY